MTLYDHLGRPVQSQALTREHAAPSLTGIRNPWPDDMVSQGLTPYRLARILRDSAEGDTRAYLELAEEMEEREPHYGSVLGTRKRAVTRIVPSVEAATDDAKDKMLADEVRGLIRRPGVKSMMVDLLDGLGKGFAAVEIHWDRSGPRWRPSRYEWVDPRWMQFDRRTGRELRLVDGSMDGAELPPFKYLIHIPKLKSGLPSRSGLARIAAASYMCKSYTLADWMRFAEVFGMPLRLGRYGPSAVQDDIDTLINAVANLGTDAAAVLPDSMRIEFEDAGQGKGGDQLYERLAGWLDKQVSKAVLGQTMTSDDGSSRAQAQVHDGVRGDIRDDDAEQLAETLNRDLVKPFIDLNWGPQEEYPAILIREEEPDDIEALSNALAKLVPLGGFGVQASVVRDRMGLPDPEPGAVLLGGDVAGQAPVTDEEATMNRARNAEGDEADPLDEIEAEALADWEIQMAPVIDPIQELADRAGSFDEFLAGLPALEMDPSEIVQRLAAAAFKARGLGDAEDGVA